MTQKPEISFPKCKFHPFTGTVYNDYVPSMLVLAGNITVKNGRFISESEALEFLRLRKENEIMRGALAVAEEALIIIVAEQKAGHGVQGIAQQAIYKIAELKK